MYPRGEDSGRPRPGRPGQGLLEESARRQARPRATGRPGPRAWLAACSSISPPVASSAARRQETGRRRHGGPQCPAARPQANRRADRATPRPLGGKAASGGDRPARRGRRGRRAAGLGAGRSGPRRRICQRAGGTGRDGPAGPRPAGGRRRTGRPQACGPSDRNPRRHERSEGRLLPAEALPGGKGRSGGSACGGSGNSRG